jgi:hypothetical protein
MRMINKTPKQKFHDGWFDRGVEDDVESEIKGNAIFGWHCICTYVCIKVHSNNTQQQPPKSLKE